MPLALALLLALTGSLLLACSSGTDAEKVEQQRSLLLFGTIIEITLYDVEESRAEQAFALLESDFARWHQDWSPWTDGELAQLNQQLAAGKAFPVDAELAALIQTAVHLSASSHNLFNPAIGKLVNLWQFHRHEEADIQPPAAAAIAQLLAARPQMSDLEFRNHSVASSNPAVQLSLGAYAKGYAINIALEKLRAMKINNAVINAGGDLKVIGQHGARNWRIGIRHPRQPGVLGWLEVQPGESVFTSGDYERFYLYQGKRMHHILDPRTGYPTTGLSSVTVVHDNAGTADAAATALMVAGPDHWYEIAKAMGIKYVMVVDDSGQAQLSPAMAERMHLSAEQSLHTRLSQPL